MSPDQNPATPDYYEDYLLGRAVAACAEDKQAGELVGLWICPPIRGTERATIDAVDATGDTVHAINSPTLADALAALLRDLGEDVPERPSAEEVQAQLDHVNPPDPNYEREDPMESEPENYPTTPGPRLTEAVSELPAHAPIPLGPGSAAALTAFVGAAAAFVVAWIDVGLTGETVGLGATAAGILIAWFLGRAAQAKEAIKQQGGI